MIPEQQGAHDNQPSSQVPNGNVEGKADATTEACHRNGHSNYIDPTNNTNCVRIHCRRCNSFILDKGKSEYCDQVVRALPEMTTTREIGQIPSKYEFPLSAPVGQFWRVNDMFTFENCGFTHQADTCKYLICADCELGPIGYHELESKVSYVALNRVLHV